MPSIYLEIECEVDASYQPAEPDVGISQGYYEDEQIEAVSVLVRDKTAKPDGYRRHRATCWNDLVAAITETHREEIADAMREASE